MNRVQRWIYGRWAIPAVAGVLILASFVASEVVGSVLWADVLMLAAAVVAGNQIVVKAVRAMVARMVGIDLLVAVAAIGAVIIGNYWEAAAVTFLFAIGHALESATLNKTRSALSELEASTISSGSSRTALGSWVIMLTKRL